MIKTNYNFKVLYIAGNGHSGSTIIDIILGSTKDYFSAGELSYITRKGLKKEYCSCNELISDCKIWNKIFELWITNMNITLKEYSELRNRYEGNKYFFKVLFCYFFPSKNFNLYVTNTKFLFEAIHIVTNATVIIDSSKISSRALILKKIVPISIIFLLRNFKGVLNSEKKNIKKDVLNGIEMNSKPKKTLSVFKNWFFTNLTCNFLVLFIESQKLFFLDFIKDPRILININHYLPENMLSKKYKADHMIAGNSIRLKSPQKIKKYKELEYLRLNSRNIYFSDLIEFFFCFWS